MARPALSASRAIEVVNFLAAHPDETFTLSELARRVGINVASTHAVLAVLEEHGWATRHLDRGYSLGPVLVPVGSAALRAHATMAAAHDAIVRLSTELGVIGLLVAAVGDEMVVTHEVTAGRPAPSRLGQRIRMSPPIGGVFSAWASADDVDAWIRSGSKSIQRDSDEIHRWLESIRVRGYAVGLETPARRGLRRAVRELSEEPASRSARGRLRSNVAELGDLATVLIEADPRDDYDVAHLAAPIHTDGSPPVLSMYLLGFRRRLTAFELERIGDRLHRAARDVVLGIGTDTVAVTGPTAGEGGLW